MKFLSKWT